MNSKSHGQLMKTLLAACAAALLTLTSTGVQSAGGADTYPDHPVRVIVPFPPGGGNDILARAMSARLTESLGQQFIVDNRGGAGGLIGGQIAATSDADGYTLFLGSMGGLAHNPALRPNLPYKPARDFAPQHGSKQATLVPVTGIDGGFADPSGFRDRVERGRVEAAVQEQAGGDLDQPLIALDRSGLRRTAAA